MLIQPNEIPRNCSYLCDTAIREIFCVTYTYRWFAVVLDCVCVCMCVRFLFNIRILSVLISV